jgi:hypothetical protein
VNKNLYLKNAKKTDYHLLQLPGNYVVNGKINVVFDTFVLSSALNLWWCHKTV